MKPIVSRLLVFALWAILAALPNLTRAAVYPVTLPPGFSLVANHLAPASISSLLGPPCWPQLMEMQTWFQLSSPYPPIASNFAFINDGTGWLDAITGDPAVFTVANGEGFWVFNPSVSTVNAQICGPANPNIVQLNPAVPGWHMAGRQNIGEGTFESTFGRSPRDYDFVHVYRWNPVTQTYVPTVHQFGQAANPLNRKWSPSAPILNIGEGAWFRLGGPSPSSPNPQYFAPGPNFTITGVTPGENAPPSPSVFLRVTGTGLANGDQIRLRNMTAPAIQTAWTAGAADPDGYILSAPMNLTGLTKGYYKVMVRKPPGAPQVLNNVFRLNTLAPQLKVNLAGPSMALAGVASPTYVMTVQNTTGSAIPGVNLDVALQSIPLANIGSVSVVPSLPFSITPPGIVLSPFTMPVGGTVTITFTVTPPLALVTSPATTLQFRGRINAPAAHFQRARLPVEVVASLDPNEKHGPIGTGPKRYITGLDPSDYVVTFENDPSATAPAHEVVITDQLDTTKFDLTTFELGAVMFGPKVVMPPSGLQTWTHNEPYDVDGNPNTTVDNILVRIEAALDANFLSPTYGQVKWKFSSLESTPPYAPVVLPNVGFLPANITAPEGQGSVSFRVTPFSNLGSGDTITNSASIVFDVNPPILTGTWTNTIDLDEPLSSVGVLPVTQNTTTFNVSWSGSDTHSGIASYDVYVSDDNGPYTLWQSAVTTTSALFSGQANHNYRFYSVATDNVGNVEEEPENPDAETTIVLATSDNCCDGCAPPYSASFTVTVQPGFNELVNPLCHGTNNFLSDVLTGVPDGTQVVRWDKATQMFTTADVFDSGFGGWVDANTAEPSGTTLPTGEGFVLFNPSAVPFTITFTGCEPQCPPHCPKTNEISFVGNTGSTPGTSSWETLFGTNCPPICGSTIRKYNAFTQNYEDYVYLGAGWSPSTPTWTNGTAVFVSWQATNCEPCEIICATNKTVECGSSWAFDPPASSCSDTTVIVLDSVTNGTCPKFITRTWSVISPGGQSNVCAQTVAVVDNTPPIITCPTNIVRTSATNVSVCYNVTATDNCSGATVVCTPPSCSLFAPGTVTPVTCVATDACGNTNTCHFTVTVNRAKGDLFIEDTPVGYTGAPDQGNEPDPNMFSQPMWMSRGIWVHEDCNQAPGTYLSHQNPRYGQQNCVQARVVNRGNAAIAGAKVEFYYANASLGLSWPAQWTLIGTYSLPPMNAGDTHIAQASWFPPGTGHYCLIARIVSAVDPMATLEGTDVNANVRANNNLAWRNVNVTDCLHAPGDKVEVRVRNFEPVPKKLTLVFTADQDFLPDGGVAILSPGSSLFQRWVDAGSKGSNVEVINGNEIRFTGSPATFEDIPFGENEERVFNLTLRADRPMPVPGSNHVYHVHLMQKIDGVTVGGVAYTIVTRGLDTDTDGDGIKDVDDPDDDNDGVPDENDNNPVGELDCPPAALTINRTGQEVTITWNGLNYRLQSVRSFGDEWMDVPNASSPYVRSTDGDHRFYRLICR